MQLRCEAFERKLEHEQDLLAAEGRALPYVLLFTPYVPPFP